MYGFTSATACRHILVLTVISVAFPTTSVGQFAAAVAKVVRESASCDFKYTSHLYAINDGQKALIEVHRVQGSVGEKGASHEKQSAFKAQVGPPAELKVKSTDRLLLPDGSIVSFEGILPPGHEKKAFPSTATDIFKYKQTAIGSHWQPSETDKKVLFRPPLLAGLVDHVDLASMAEISPSEIINRTVEVHGARAKARVARIPVSHKKLGEEVILALDDQNRLLYAEYTLRAPPFDMSKLPPGAKVRNIVEQTLTKEFFVYSRDGKYQKHLMDATVKYDTGAKRYLTETVFDAYDTPQRKTPRLVKTYPEGTEVILRDATQFKAEWRGGEVQKVADPGILASFRQGRLFGNGGMAVMVPFVLALMFLAFLRFKKGRRTRRS